MRKLIALFVLLTVSTFAQYTYTTNYNITKIASGTLNWADTLNNNWTKVDAAIKLREDTIGTVKADFYAEHNYDGTHQDNKLTLAALQTAEKAKLVQTTGMQTVAGLKTFSDGIVTATELRVTAAATTNSGALWFTPTSFNELMFRSSTAQDTIPDKAWVRTNYVGTATAQTVTGAKTFSASTTISGTAILYDVKVSTFGYATLDYGDSTVVYAGSYWRITDGYGTNYTMVGLTGAVEGNIVYILNPSSTYSVTFVDGAIFFLGATRVLGYNDTLTLLNIGSNKWAEIGYSNN